jgi:hypothetical protein
VSTVTETEIKLKDAAIQLQLAVDNMADEDVFRSCVNSFISTARSVTMVMEKESKGNPELWAWYKSQTDRFAVDPVMRFFNEQRIHTVHRGNVKPKSQSIPLRNTTDPADVNQQTVSIWVFHNVQEYLPEETGNVFRMCDHYLAQLNGMVAEWRYLKAVIEVPRDVIDQLQSDRARLQGHILGLRSELDQAKLTLELLNDILKAKGDGSQTEWVQQLTLRIDRLLNPEYFQKAPAVRPLGTVAFNKTGKLRIYTILVSPTEAITEDAEGVYATIRNDYAKDEDGNPIFDKEFGFSLWGTNLKGPLPSGLVGFSSSSQAEQAALSIYKTLRY